MGDTKVSRNIYRIEIMISIAIDILFIVLFLCFVAHEKGWFATRILSWILCIEDFGKNRAWHLWLDYGFAGLWSWFLYIDIGKLIQS